MGAVALRVAVAPHEGLRPVGGPQAAVIERARVPHGLECDVRHAHGVRGRARPVRHEPARAAVVHVVLVVGRVQVLAIPARREVMNRHDSRRAGRRREVDRLGEARHHVLQTRVPKVGGPAARRGGAADGHAKALGEGEKWGLAHEIEAGTGAEE